MQTLGVVWPLSYALRAMPLFNRPRSGRLNGGRSTGGHAPRVPPKRRAKARQEKEKSMEKKTKKEKKPKSETRQKTGAIAFRVTPEEMAEIQTAAEEAGLTIGSLCRVTLLKKVRTGQRRKPLADVVLLGQLLAQLGKTGNNLNQIAKRMNEQKGVTAGRVFSALDELRILKESIIKALRWADDCEGQKLQSHREPS